MTCPSCRAEVPSGARFCPACGHDLRLRGDERRVVTVLFADLVGYTSMSENRDPEQVKNLVDSTFERLVADIEAFGGRVDKIIGDAIVALFGAPVAHEDDAERAVRAALRMQETVAACSHDMDVDLQIRVGVNTGEVLVGALRAGGDYTAMGDVVNTASRLQVAAPPGGVLVGAATYAATRRVVSYETLDPIDAKGREALVPAWRADAAIAPPGYRGDRDRAELIGRESEMGLLRHSVGSSVRNSRASLLLVLGEAGVGKSRLAQELALAVEREHKAIVLEGRCVPYGEANVWWPIADALRYGSGIRSSDPESTALELAEQAVRTALGDAREEEVERVLQGLLYLMGYDSDLRAIDPTRAREEATAALVTCVERFSIKHPVVMVLSDLHWADDLVLELIDTLLDRLAGHRFVVLATARRTIEERWHPPHGRRHNLVVLTLDPLTADGAAELLEQLAGEEVGPELAEALLERSGGNPFFLEELVTLLAEAGVLGAGSAPAGAGVAAIELPDTLRGLVSARLDGLAVEERRVLEDCAVLGRRGPVSAIEVMAHKHLRLDDVMPVLRALEDKELLVLSGSGPRATWQFRSDVVREVAYGTLTKTDRARSHQGIAAWIEAHEDTHRDDIVDRITHHYVRAAELANELGGVEGLPPDISETALRWLERVADRTERAEMSFAAERLYSEGLRLLAGEHGPRHRAFLTGRARALAHQRELAPARSDAAAAIREARVDDAAADLGRALIVLADIEQKEGDALASETALDEARDVFERIGDASGQAEVLRLRGFGALIRHEYDRATQLLEEALARFEALGDRRGVAWALQNLAWCAFYCGRAEAAEARLRLAADTFAEIGDKGGLGWARGLLAWTRFQQGHSAEAGQIAEGIIDDIRGRGDRWPLGMMLVLLGSVRLWTGRASESIECLEEARGIFRAIGDGFGEMQAAAVLGRALVSMGRLSDGFEVLSPAELPAAIPGALTDEDRERFFAVLAPLGASVHIGDVDRTAELLDHMEPEPSARAPGGILVGDVERAVALALHRVQIGDAGGAVAAIEPLRTRIAPDVDPNVSSAAALVHAAAGDIDEAIAAADEAESHGGASYLDAIIAGVARGLALGRRGDHAASLAAFDQVRAAADATDDRVARAITRLADATAAPTRGEVDAAERMCEADSHLADLGLEATGWRRAFELALGLGATA